MRWISGGICRDGPAGLNCLHIRNAIDKANNLRELRAAVGDIGQDHQKRLITPDETIGLVKFALDTIKKRGFRER